MLFDFSYLKNEKMTPFKIVLLSISMFQCLFANSQVAKYNYKDKLESNSKLVTRGYNYTIEKLKDGTHILKKYYPETKVVTQHLSYKTKKFQIKHGWHIERYDDGELLSKGKYLDDEKQGIWREHNSQGEYRNGMKVGKWETVDSDGKLTIEEYFKNGELDGKQIRYDTLGNIQTELLYEAGELISPLTDTTMKIVEIMPRFLGCEDMEGSDSIKKKCADQKMLEYIFKRLKYPKKARKQEIEGTAIIRFVIEKDGTINDIKVLRGLSKEIKEVCYNLVSQMPKWRPGYQNGKPVRVQFNLPIKFYLR